MALKFGLSLSIISWIFLSESLDSTSYVAYTLKANGRGAYLKKDRDVINKARATKALENVLEVTIPDSIYDEMLEKINQKEVI